MKKKLLIIGGIILFIVLAVSIVLIVRNEKIEEKTDAIKFKESYESLNGTTTSSGKTYNTVSISKDNPFKYVNAKEAVDIIKNGEGIIYFGANWCPWCRNAVPVLLSMASKNKLENIYYVDMDSLRNLWSVVDGKLVKTRVEEEGYYELLDSLSSILTDYVITDNNIEYEVGEKRIYMPLVIAVKNGKILANHTSTVELNENQTAYDKLTSEQYDELYNIYNEMVTLMMSSSCDAVEPCN